jgi:hypothetical protein
MVAEFEEAFSLEPRSATIKTEYGYHIIQPTSGSRLEPELGETRSGRRGPHGGERGARVKDWYAGVQDEMSSGSRSSMRS